MQYEGNYTIIKEVSLKCNDQLNISMAILKFLLFCLGNEEGYYKEHNSSKL